MPVEPRQSVRTLSQELYRWSLWADSQAGASEAADHWEDAAHHLWSAAVALEKALEED